MKVIDPKRLPTRLPIISTITVWLAVDRLALPLLWRGVIGTLVVLYWGIAVYVVIKQEYTDVF